MVRVVEAAILINEGSICINIQKENQYENMSEVWGRIYRLFSLKEEHPHYKWDTAERYRQEVP